MIEFQHEEDLLITSLGLVEDCDKDFIAVDAEQHQKFILWELGHLQNGANKTHVDKTNCTANNQ